jgi:hypothetical protein
MRVRCHGHRPLSALVALLAALGACTQRDDVVARAVPPLDGGSKDAATSKADGGGSDRCRLEQRLSRSPLGYDISNQLLLGHCTLPAPVLMPLDAGAASNELIKLFAQVVQSNDGGTHFHCAENGTGFEGSLGAPRVTLCPNTCSGASYGLKRWLAQDGCDDSFDAGSPPSFTLPPRGMPGMRDAAVADDAGHVADAG